MNLLQAFLIAVLGWLSSIYGPLLIGGLGGWYTLGRPLVSGFVIGLILGDVKTGILMGAAIQTLYIGLVTPGGAMPADVNYASWIGIPLAMVAGAGTEYALALSVPLSALGVLAVYGLCAINLFFVHKQDNYIDNYEFDKAARIPIVGQITNFVLRFIPIFAINYFGSGLITTLIGIIPEQITDILQVFANLLPMVGFMLLMKTLVRSNLDLVLYSFGFILISVFESPMVAIVIIALLIAMMSVSGKIETMDLSKLKSSDTTDTPALSKKATRKAYVDWMFWNLSLQNFERMEGPAFVRMFSNLREELYPGDKEAQRDLLKRHSVFFNTEPFLGAIVPGIAVGLETAKAKSGDESISGDFVNSIKTALMGPLAGIGDSLLPGTLIPILLSIALGLSENGEVTGPIFYIIIFLGIMLPLTWFLFNFGIKSGINGADRILSSGLKDVVTEAAKVLGIIVVGAVSASYTHVNIGLEFVSGELVINLGEILNSILPGISILIFAFFMYYLMVKKNWGTAKVILLCLILAVVGYFTTILAV